MISSLSPQLFLCFALFSPPQNLILPYHLIKYLIQFHSIIKNLNPRTVVALAVTSRSPFVCQRLCKESKSLFKNITRFPVLPIEFFHFFAHKVFVTFNSTTECFPRKDKCVACGNLVRLSLMTYVSKVVQG